MKLRTRRVQERNGRGTDDPYYNQHQPEDHSYCKKCHAIFHHKHWFFDQDTLAKLQKNSAPQVLCPACKKIEDKFASGIVTLKGNFLKEHHEEILNLIHNEEDRAKGLNPLERIIEILSENDGLEVTTTHERLAQKIGKRLHRSFNGRVSYQWTPQDKMARVDWYRE